MHKVVVRNLTIARNAPTKRTIKNKKRQQNNDKKNQAAPKYNKANEKNPSEKLRKISERTKTKTTRTNKQRAAMEKVTATATKMRKTTPVAATSTTCDYNCGNGATLATLLPAFLPFCLPACRSDGSATNNASYYAGIINIIVSERRPQCQNTQWHKFLRKSISAENTSLHKYIRNNTKIQMIYVFA